MIFKGHFVIVNDSPFSPGDYVLWLCKAFVFFSYYSKIYGSWFLALAPFLFFRYQHNFFVLVWKVHFEENWYWCDNIEKVTSLQVDHCCWRAILKSFFKVQEIDLWYGQTFVCGTNFSIIHHNIFNLFLH